jgi:tetratricopeptide (TPR) repeat protein
VHFERGRLLLHEGLAVDAIDALETALNAARTAGNVELEVRILTEFTHTFRGMHIDRALEAAETALAIAEERADAAGQIRALNKASLLYTDGLRLDRAAASGERALVLARQLEDEACIAEALDAVKLVACQLGDTERLEPLTAELARIQRRQGALWYLCWTLQESAHVPLAALQLDDAETRLQEALEIAERIGASGACSMVLDSLAAVHEARGEPDAAIAACERAVELAQRGVNGGLVAWMHATAGLVCLRVRAVTRAAAHLQEGMTIAEDVASRHEMLRCAAVLAHSMWLRGEKDAARRLAERAEALCREVRTPPDHALLLLAPAIAATAEVLTAAGEPEHAERLVREPLRAARGPRKAWYAVPLAIAAARCLVALGRTGEAEGALRPALDAWRAGTFAPAWEALIVQVAIDRAAGRDDACAAHAREARDAIGTLAGRMAHAKMRQEFAWRTDREIADYAATSSQTTS